MTCSINWGHSCACVCKKRDRDEGARRQRGYKPVLIGPCTAGEHEKHGAVKQNLTVSLALLLCTSILSFQRYINLFSSSLLQPRSALSPSSLWLFWAPLQLLYCVIRCMYAINRRYCEEERPLCKSALVWLLASVTVEPQIKVLTTDDTESHVLLKVEN